LWISQGTNLAPADAFTFRTACCREGEGLMMG
jgi:hypothetical protein